MKKRYIAGLIAASMLCLTAVGCSDNTVTDNRIKDLFDPYDRGDNVIGADVEYSDANAKIDGNLTEDMWKNATWNDMKSEQANRTGNNLKYELDDCDISATAIVRDNGLFVGIKSTDNVAYAGKILKVDNKPILSAFAQTGVSLYFSDSDDAFTGGRPCYEIGFSVAESVKFYYHDANGSSERALRNMSVKAKINGQINSSEVNGYTIEAFIPWSDLGNVADGEVETIMATFATHRHPAFERADTYDGKKLTFEMLEMQQGAGWLAPLTWKEYGASGKMTAGITSSDKYGDYDETLKSNMLTLFPKNGVFINATGGQKYSYVKNVHGKNLYAEAVVKNVNVNWGMAGFAFRDVLTPPAYEPQSEGSSRLIETDNGAVWAGMRYGGDNKGQYLYSISTDLTDVGDISKASNTYVIGTPENYDDSKGATGVKVATYISENGTVLLYINDELKKIGYAKHLAGKDLCVSFAGRDVSCIYGDISVLSGEQALEKVKADLAEIESDVYGDYSADILADASAVYGNNGDVSLNKTKAQQYLYVKNLHGNKLYAKATISNVDINWGVIGFAFRDVEDLTKTAWLGLRYGGAEKSNHLYVISTNLSDVGNNSLAGNYNAQGTEETFDNSKGDTGVTVEVMIDSDGVALMAINGVVKRYVTLDFMAGKDMIVAIAGRDSAAQYKNVEILAGEQASAKIAAHKSTVISDVYGDYNANIAADARAIYGQNGEVNLAKTSGQQYLYVKNLHGNKLYAKATISNVDTNFGVIGFAFRDVEDLTKTAWLGMRYGGADKSNHLYAISTNLSDVGNNSLAGNYSAQGTDETFDNSKGTTGVTVEVMIDSDGVALIVIDGVIKRYVTLDFMAGKDMIVALAGRDIAAQYKNVEILAGEQASAKIASYKSTVISDVYGDYNANIAADARAVYGQNGEVNLAKTSGQQYLYVKNLHGSKLYAKATISNVDTNWGVIGFAFRDATDLSKSVWAGLRFGGTDVGQHLYMISTKLSDVGDINGNNYVIGKPATYDNSKGATGVTVEAYIDETGSVCLCVDGEIALSVKLTEFAGKDMIVSIAGRDCAATYKDVTVKEGTQASDALNASVNVKGATFSATDLNGLYQNGIDLSNDVVGANPSVEITVPSNGQRYSMYNNAIDSNKVFAQYTIKSLGTATANKNGAVTLAFVNADGNVTYYGMKYGQSESAATADIKIQSYYSTDNSITPWPDNGKERNDMTYANAGFPDDSGLLDKLNGNGLTFTVYCDGEKYHYYLNGVPVAGWHGSYTRSIKSSGQQFEAVGTSNIVKALIVVENAHVKFSDYKIASGDAAVTSFDDFLESAGGGVYGDYDATLKADAVAVTNGNNDVCLVKTSGTQYSYLKSVKSDTLYIEARIGNVNVNWGAIGFAFRDVDSPNSVAFSTLRYGGNVVANFGYTVATNAADVCGDTSYFTAGTEADLNATFGKDKSEGVLLQAYVDNAGNVYVAVNGVVKKSRNVATLAGKQLCVALFGGNAGGVYKNVSVKTGADATAAFNALTQA